ncbi:MAG: hypothetical protein K6E95_00240 [Lachnospiraceae bacterium]|nr:hypothetical protein [Lachnospiraceae bacterium]
MSDKKETSSDQKMKLWITIIVFGIIIIVSLSALGNTIYKNIKRDEDGFRERYANIQEYYKLTDWNYKDGVFKVFVNGDIWNSMSNDKKLSYCENICKATINSLHEFYIEDSLFFPSVKFYDMSGQVAKYDDDLILILK